MPKYTYQIITTNKKLAYSDGVPLCYVERHGKDWYATPLKPGDHYTYRQLDLPSTAATEPPKVSKVLFWATFTLALAIGLVVFGSSYWLFNWAL